MTQRTMSLNPRRSNRQRGLDVIPQELVTCKRAKKRAEPVKSKVTIEREADKDEQAVQEEEFIEREADKDEQPVQEEEFLPEAEQYAEGNGAEQYPEDGAKQYAEEVDKTGEEEEADQDKTNQTSTEECVTQQSNTKKRRTRGPTRMSRVAKRHEEKVDVEWTSLGEHVGKGSVTLSSFLGPLVREHVPVLFKDWRGVDEKIKDTLWEEIQERFNLTEDWQKNCVFRQMGCIWKSSKARLVKKVRATRNMTRLQNLKPSNIHNDAA